MDAPAGSHAGVAEREGQPSALAPKYRQSCERCRKSKLKCVMDSLQEPSKCGRCFAAGKECVFEPVGPRQRRKRTDARVTTLEKELGRMKSMVDHLQSFQTPGSPPTAFTGSSSANIDMRTAASARTSRSPQLDASRSQLAEQPPAAHSLDTWPPPDGREPGSAAHSDPWDFISDELAAGLLAQFVAEILPQFPLVAFSADDTYQQLRISRPLLLLAAMTAASGAREASLFEKLHSRLIRAITERAIICGERNLELVQAILILETWYCPPDDLGRMNFYQWIHIAGTMAMQLGLGGATLPKDDNQENFLSAEQLPGLRTMLAVFESCSSVAVSLNRQSMITFTKTAQIRTSAFAKSALSLNDKRLVAWVKLQLLAEKVEAIKGKLLSGPEGASISAHEQLHDLKEQFTLWETSLDPDVMNVSLRVHLTYCIAKLHELTLHAVHDVRDLVPPYLSAGGQASLEGKSTSVSPTYVRAVLSLITACHALLRAIVDADSVELRSSPTITFVRPLFAIKALSILGQALRQPYHTISQIIDEDTLQIPEFLDLLANSLRRAGGEMACKVPTKMAFVARKIAGVHSSPLKKGATGGTADLGMASIHVLGPNYSGINGSSRHETQDESPGFTSRGSDAASASFPTPINPLESSGSFEEDWQMAPSSWGDITGPEMSSMSDFEGMFMPFSFPFAQPFEPIGTSAMYFG